MKRISVSLVIVWLTLCIATGCQTSKDALAAEGRGTAYVYFGSLDTVWEGVLEAFEFIEPEGGPQIFEKAKDKSYLAAKTGMSMWSYGEQVVVFFTVLDGKRVRVEVVSKAKLSTNVTAKHWDRLIHQELALILKRAPVSAE